MVRAPCCEKMGLKKGPWTPEEDQILISHIEKYGHDNWRALPKKAGLLRCGKSCRLRWLNYLRPDIKRGNFTKEEEETIIKLHEMLGNRWSAIAAKLPGRTDNEIKNVWHTHLKKKLIKISNHSVDQEITKRHDEYSVKDEAAEVHDMSSSKYDYNIMENIRPISPPQSSSTSDISSVNTTDYDNNDDDHNNNNNNNNTSTKVNSPVNFSEMADDESFWSEVFSTESSYSEVLVDFSTINSEPLKFQFSPLVMTSESLDDFGSNIMDFWHHIFIKSGDLLAEF